MKIVILCSSDIVWATPVWEQTIPALKSQNYEIIELIEISGKPKPRHSYFRAFGPLCFFKLALYAFKIIMLRVLLWKPVTLKQLCRSVGVKHTKIRSPKDSITLDKLENNGIDLIISMTDFILSKKLIGVPKLGILNKHASLLPANKGILPFFWAEIKSEKQGVSYHLMDEKIDEGPIIYQYKLSPAKFNSLIAFYRQVFSNYPQDIVKTTQMIISNKRELVDSSQDSYNSFPDKSEVTKFRQSGGKIISYLDFL